MRLNRAEEIDYYEELGVERNAAPEAIRDSFRALVRLLHPDQQTDEHLKSIAEKQLRKVNRIYAVLSDPERRREYDEMLEEGLRPPAVVFSAPATNITAKALVTRMVWIGLAMLGVAIVIWLATDPPSGPVLGSAPVEHASSSPKQTPAASTQSSKPDVAPAARPASPVPASDAREIVQLKADLRAARMERDEAKRELAEVKSEDPMNPPHPSNPLTAASTSMTDLTPPRVLPYPPHAPSGPVVAALGLPGRTPKPPGSDPHQFAGFWFFARSSFQTPHNTNLYPPEFIEAVLTEQNGVVHGRYRSRYQIVDRAISPDVNFEFTGSPSGPVIVSAWSGTGGARGQITLRMTDENSIKIDWTASELGSIQGLASGTATLTRRLE